jgi:hypothetical protein
MSAKGYAKRCAAVLAFCKKAITQRKLGLYGACTFTHNVIQMIETPSTLTIFDGDERKEGKYMSGIAKPVHSWRDIDSSGVAGVLIMPLGFTKEIVAFLRTKGYSRKLEPLFKNLR